MESDKPPGARISVKLAAYVATWLLALFATNPSFEYWSLAYLFPLGLAAFVNLRLGNDGGWGVLGFCYAIYILHAVFYFRSKTVRSTVLLFALLVVLLICTIS